MTNQMKVAGELAELHHFGSYNIYMSTASVDHSLLYYPWCMPYEQLPFEGAYPQPPHMDSCADASFDTLSLRLVGLAADEDLYMEVSLQYPMGIPVVRVWEGYLTLITTNPNLVWGLEGLPVEMLRELRLDMFVMSPIQYILQTEIVPEKQAEVALVEMPHEGVGEESEEMRPL